MRDVSKSMLAGFLIDAGFDGALALKAVESQRALMQGACASGTCFGRSDELRREFAAMQARMTRGGDMRALVDALLRELPDGYPGKADLLERAGRDPLPGRSA